jgi:hypothetical protein
MADDHAELTVDTPVDEEAEALIAAPVQAFLLVQGADFRVVGGGAGQDGEIDS